MAAFAAVLAVTSMLLYPGGTVINSDTRGYSLTQNFLSDLGTTVAFDGRPNMSGALLFMMSVALVGVASVECLRGFLRLHVGVARAHGLARAATVLGSIVCLAFLGVALAPENRAMSLHVQLTLLAFRLAPLVVLLLALAARADRGLPGCIPAVWMGLTLILTAYVIELAVGPSPSTPHGLLVQVLVQKAVVLSSTVAIVVQSAAADRVISTSRAT